MGGREGLGVCAVALLSLAVAPAHAGREQIPVVRLHVGTEIAAPPAAVWAFMTAGKNYATWCPEWKSPLNAKVNIAKVGDVLDFTDQWGGGGRSIVTYLVKDKELRVTHEPNKGDYVCQAKLILEPTAKGTRVHFWEQYTDESKPEEREATATKVEAEMGATLAALRKALEKK